MDAGVLRSGALIDWAVAGRALPGEARSGDHHVVVPFPGGALVSVIDGLGHGPGAADAAEAAGAVLVDHAGESPVSLVRRCHDELRATRGVAMSVVSLSTDRSTMSWLGVGNVEVSLYRRDRLARPARESLLLRGGVVGYRIPNLLASEVPVGAGDVLVLATDGVDSAGFVDLSPARAPQVLADDLLRRFARITDDALVLVARYVGDAA